MLALLLPVAAAQSVVLQGAGVAVRSTLQPNELTLSVTCLAPSEWASIAVGDAMAGAHAYVLWRAGDAFAFSAFAMASLDASSFADSAENVTLLSASSSSSGALSFSFSRPLSSTGAAPPVDPSRLHLLWALGNGWTTPVGNAAQHFARSDVATIVNLETGAVSLGSPRRAPAALVAHAVLMSFSVLFALPAAVAAARYLRPLAPALPVSTSAVLMVPSAPGPKPARPAWLSLHIGCVMAALACAVSGTACLAAMPAYTLVSVRASTTVGASPAAITHARLGVAALALLVAQPIGGWLRPKAQGSASMAVPLGGGSIAAADAPRFRRRAWAAIHRVGGAAAAAVAVAAVATGLDAADATAAFGGGAAAALAASLRRALYVWLGCLGAGVVAAEAAAAVTARKLRRIHLAYADEFPTSKPYSVHRRVAAAAAAVWVVLSAVLTTFVAAGVVGSASGSTNHASLGGASPPAPSAAAPPSPPVAAGRGGGAMAMMGGMVFVDATTGFGPLLFPGASIDTPPEYAAAVVISSLFAAIVTAAAPAAARVEAAGAARGAGGARRAAGFASVVLRTGAVYAAMLLVMSMNVGIVLGVVGGHAVGWLARSIWVGWTDRRGSAAVEDSLATPACADKADAAEAGGRPAAFALALGAVL